MSAERYDLLDLRARNAGVRFAELDNRNRFRCHGAGARMADRFAAFQAVSPAPVFEPSPVPMPAENGDTQRACTPEPNYLYLSVPKDPADPRRDLPPALPEPVFAPEPTLTLRQRRLYVLLPLVGYPAFCMGVALLTGQCIGAGLLYSVGIGLVAGGIGASAICLSLSSGDAERMDQRCRCEAMNSVDETEGNGPV